MRIAISNIAWDVSEDEKISELLSKYQIDAIDIAPSKYFPDPINTTDKDITKVKSFWTTKGFEISGMQSLLFGTQGLNIFGSKESQRIILDHLSAIARIAEGLGVKRLVFGSPKNRDRADLSDEQTLNIAKEFFTKLGNIALKYEVIFCLEPNPRCYGANFMTTSRETLDIVLAINHPSIKMQLDTGAITINNESITDILTHSQNLIGHIHISEPNLIVVGDGDTDHKNYAKAIKTHIDNPLISIEMVATQNELHINSIERATAFVTNIYRKS